MFFVLSKLLSMLLFPYPLFLLVALWAALRMRPGRSRFVFRVALALCIAISVEAGSGALMRPLEQSYPQVPTEAVPRADAVVVLAGMINPLRGSAQRPEFLGSVDRILYGEHLLRQARAPRLVLSGGTGLLLQRGSKEAAVLGRWLVAERGLAAGQVIVEAESRNTYENAEAVARIARERGWRRVLLVTSAFHMARSVGCFRAVGLEVVPLPTDYYSYEIFPGPEALVPSPGALAVSTMALKEYLGIGAYWATGRLRLAE